MRRHKADRSVTLQDLFGEDPAQSLRLELLIGACLARAGAWPTQRHSDGVSAARIVESGGALLRLCGVVFTVAQRQLLFWLELEPAGAPATFALRLWAEPTHPHKPAQLVHTLQGPAGTGWRVAVKGLAAARGAELELRELENLSAGAGPL